MSQAPKTRSSSPASGTKSLINGDRPSVRFPRRIVPICVKLPIGLAIPLRIASTPAMNVVVTAPIPTRRTPSLPLGSAIGAPFCNMVHSPIVKGCWFAFEQEGYRGVTVNSAAILLKVVAGLLREPRIEDRRSRIEDRLIHLILNPWSSVFDPRSSTLDPRPSTLDLRSSTLDLRSRRLGGWTLANRS